ncbi:hypothetical protein NDU88_004467 [Pleurodeles waltl]|uniref:Uncharacterized protein n=1 Tax=Pleurodeles waltl TaxID=8319 RepID=A0AAV7W525_PLEWA|nr:hypothetical protein NDU88_004467 [Pleurodeles waltl]
MASLCMLRVPYLPCWGTAPPLNRRYRRLWKGQARTSTAICPCTLLLLCRAGGVSKMQSLRGHPGGPGRLHKSSGALPRTSFHGVTPCWGTGLTSLRWTARAPAVLPARGGASSRSPPPVFSQAGAGSPLSVFCGRTSEPSAGLHHHARSWPQCQPWTPGGRPQRRFLRSGVRLPHVPPGHRHLRHRLSMPMVWGGHGMADDITMADHVLHADG